MIDSAAGSAPVKTWKEQKEMLKTKFSNLTDADLHYDNGKKEEMMEKVQVKPGKTKEEMKTIISTL